ncbi:MAG: DUF58 domain-containing protein [Treponema sp.]|jgi:hypothetical protein|nr:DUF58 domain-containing protein [Treponema sp.]
MRAVFIPQTTGVFILLIIILAFIAGAVRRELVLSLIGAVFLAVWLYCLVMTLFLALINRRRAGRVLIRINPGNVAVGKRVEIIYSEKSETVRRKNSGSFRMPGILIRRRVLLSTKDGREIRHDFDPAITAPETFIADKRGAYFSDYDEFAVFDALGFFRFIFRIPMENSARLLASPGAAEDPVSARSRAGESNVRPELSFQRSENLIDHRPYVPGDDPRRINWKLYGHGGELFVRENEREPPTHSKLLILVDTQFDSLLYSAESAGLGVDMLCENALAAALACAELGQDVQIGYSGVMGTIDGNGGVSPVNSPAGLAVALAWPAALPLSTAAELPAAPEDRGILILALPRVNAESSALDRFLRDLAGRSAGRNENQTADLIFMYGAGSGKGESASVLTGLASAAETCVAMYNRRPGVRARTMVHGYQGLFDNQPDYRTSPIIEPVHKTI